MHLYEYLYIYIYLYTYLVQSYDLIVAFKLFYEHNLFMGEKKHKRINKIIINLNADPETIVPNVLVPEPINENNDHLMIVENTKSKSKSKSRSRSRSHEKSNLILNELITKQLDNVSPDKKLKFPDIKRISKFLKKSIFDEKKCSIWNGYVTNEQNASKGTYINFYFNKKKIALHRLLYINYVDSVSDNEYIKFTCGNKGKCCNVKHMHKYAYNKLLGAEATGELQNNILENNVIPPPVHLPNDNVVPNNSTGNGDTNGVKTNRDKTKLIVEL